jgi:hypothetical protein
MNREKDNLRERGLLQLFLVLNVGLAGAFVVYLFLTHSNQPKVVSTSFGTPPQAKTNLATNSLRALALKAVERGSNLAAGATNATATTTNASKPEDTAVSPAPANASPPVATFTKKKFNWETVEASDYLSYLESLRAVGCPEDKIRYIVLSDINELFDKRREKAAVEHDPQFWRAGPDYLLVNVLQEKGRALEEERRNLIARLLGPDTLENDKNEATLWTSVQLTGKALGALPLERHNQVQEICARSMERHQAALWARMGNGQALTQNSVEMAKLREQTRADLRQALNPQEMEEFLLRYSHNAHNLRLELSGMNPGEEEFRRIFRATDPIDHQMQLEFGGVETMSLQQRERYERQRDTAIKEVLNPPRDQAYLMTKDPLYRQAQMYARQYNAPPETVMPIYQMTKATETKRQQIRSNASLTPEQREQALRSVDVEQQQGVLRIITEAAARPKQ